MAKDPAFLFYSSDFLTGVTDMTMEERGQYITLLCLQHQKGRLSEKTCRLSLGLSEITQASDVMAKFIKDEDGFYYNKRLEDEVLRRKKSADASRNNGILGGRPKKHETYEEPNKNLQVISRITKTEPRKNLSEDENENITEDKDLIETFFETAWGLYPNKKGKGSVSKSAKSKRFKLGDEFIRAIERYVEHVKGKDAQFIMHGSTFFNSGYVDYLDANYTGREVYAKDSTNYKTAHWLANSVYGKGVTHNEELLQSWAKCVDDIIVHDGREKKQAGELLKYSRKDEFWKDVIISMPKFREHYDTLLARYMSEDDTDEPETLGYRDLTKLMHEENAAG